MTFRQWVYLILAVLGVVVPWYFNLQFVRESGGLSYTGFFQSALAGGPAAVSLTVDITIAYLAFCVWAVVEGRRLGMRHLWFYIAWATLVAFASALPLFFWFRERCLQLEESRGAKPG